MHMSKYFSKKNISKSGISGMFIWTGFKKEATDKLGSLIYMSHQDMISGEVCHN